MQAALFLSGKKMSIDAPLSATYFAEAFCPLAGLTGKKSVFFFAVFSLRERGLFCRIFLFSFLQLDPVHTALPLPGEGGAAESLPLASRLGPKIQNGVPGDTH
jgi:hypothetical protein